MDKKVDEGGLGCLFIALGLIVTVFGIITGDPVKIILYFLGKFIGILIGLFLIERIIAIFRPR
jgi:hypothetical protein